MYGFVNRWTFLLSYIWIFSAANSLKIRDIKDITEDCLYGYFKDGDVCKECPAGYTGLNCSQICTLPTYGVLCGEICNCSFCHHEVGCISTPELTGAEQETTIVTEPCLFNQYKDGNDCKDCPAGYFGNDCTERCVLPSFGRACSDICNCTFCHHVFGCILSSEFKECQAGYFGRNCSDRCPWPTYGAWCNQTCSCATCDHIVGCMTITVATDDVSESLNEQKASSTVKGISFTELANLIILLTGGTITLVLLVLIFYTIWRYRSLVNINCNDVEARTIHGLEPVYYELNERTI